MLDTSFRSRIRAARTMLRFAWEADQRSSILAFGLIGLEGLAQILFAFWLKLLLDGVDRGDQRPVMIAAIGITCSIAGVTTLAYYGSLMRRLMSERAHHLVERRLLDLVAHIPTLDIQETPAHLAQLELLESESWEFGSVIPSILTLFTILVRIVTTLLVLLSIHPLLLLLPLFGLPALLLSSRTSNLYQLGNELAAEPSRRANYLFDLATTSAAAKELRLFRLGDEVLARFHSAHHEVQAIHQRLNMRGAALKLLTRCFFLIGFFGAIVFMVNRALAGQATAGDAVLTATLAGQVLGLVAGSAELIQFAWSSLATASRFVYLQDVATQAVRPAAGTGIVPTRLHDGIRLEGITYRYPLGESDTLHDITLDLPAGSTVALVGDNGAGKTTLVKLLAGLYIPSGGRILIDGTDLSTLDAEQWRTHVAAGFQDHARWEFIVRETVGIGDLTALDDEARVVDALERAGASDMLPTLPAGTATQLGPSWPAGVDLSGGQWQKLALGRAMMRTSPLLLLLDEPTAALDADTEHRLFERWTAAARDLRRATGAVTVLVSHRFSTVQMADLIVVLDHGRIVEQGNHAALLARGGLYAELFELQARSYR